jgi:hypothetical protein
LNNIDILSGLPVSWLLNQSILPIYVLIHWIVFHIPILSRIWLRLLLLLDPFFTFFLCIGRGFSLVNGIYVFKNHPTHSHITQASITGQLIVGILSSCGSTILYSWLLAAWNYLLSVKGNAKKTKRSTVELFPHPGYNFYVSFGVSILIIILSDSTLCSHAQDTLQFIECAPTKQDLSVISTILMIISTMFKF